MKIVILEDDYLQLEWIVDEIKSRISSAQIIKVNTEQEFTAQLDEFSQHPPDIFVIDMLVRWTDPSPNMPEPPEDVERESFFRAGLRCVKKLLEHDSTKGVPIIIYTVLEESDLKNDLSKLPPNISYIQKSENPMPLIQVIRAKVR